MGSNGKFNLRSLLLLSFLLIWAAVAAAHVFYYASVKGKELKTESDHLAWREGSLPGIRGRLLDKNGTALAWTELVHDLVLDEPPENASRMKKLQGALKSIGIDIPREALESGNLRGLAIRKGMAPHEIELCQKELSSFPELKIKPRLERRVIAYPEAKAIIGEISAENGELKMRGISGAEREFDARLSERAGSFVVMLDRKGNWVDGSLRIKKQPKNGENVSLPVSLDELILSGVKENGAH